MPAVAWDDREQLLIRQQSRVGADHASTAIIASLASWARDSGATGACLQVEAGNTPARALYDAFGLGELYRYHYRREPGQR